MTQSIKLSPRLNEIFELIAKLQADNIYTHIWDCCCDHGYLGMKVLSVDCCATLNFVDQIPHIMEQLSSNLKTFDFKNYNVITKDAGQLIFDSKQRHLAIIAGVGGERTVELLSSIAKHNPNSNIDYIFCPSTSEKALRQYLVAQNFGLAFESIICEKKRCYEVIYVQSSDTERDLPSITLSCEVWEEGNPEHQEYLKKINAHRGSMKLNERAKPFV